MSLNKPIEFSHDIHDITGQFPDLAPSPEMSEAALKQLEVKYNIILQIADQTLKGRELDLKERTSRTDRWANPLTVAVLVGALGLLGNFINGIWSNRNQRAQLENQNTAERIKLENDLIKEAIKPAEETGRAKSLVFFAKNGLIHLDPKTLASLEEIIGSDGPVIPASSGSGASASIGAKPITFVQAIVDRILASPGVPYPPDARATPHLGDDSRKAIILHDAMGTDGAVGIMRSGRPALSGIPALPGPLAHWVVQSDGKIVFIADETEKANHVGVADFGLENSNTIGISVTGVGALSDDRQTENLVRLVADVADRWGIPTNRIFSHAEVSKGRKIDMQQQAPVIRQMVDMVRKK
ncbi:MAG TPA: N-acetylmuramoyl-L-alanine amidase [Pyrinomonadaceae bacterium]|nr:N-acetylmuramoyl-L-alanine amidase [Pyrinomonadaceae bacterium]